MRVFYFKKNSYIVTAYRKIMCIFWNNIINETVSYTNLNVYGTTIFIQRNVNLAKCRKRINKRNYYTQALKKSFQN